MSEINTDKRESILAKIRALMAKTPENGCTEAEAKAAAAMVDTLLEKYEIDLDEVALRKQEFTQAEIMNGWLHPVGQAATGIAKFTDCKCWISEKKKIVYFGFSVDCEIAEYLTLLFKRAIDREAAAFTLFNADYDAATKRERTQLVASFGIGMAVRLGDRLRELKSKRDFSMKSAGNALVVLKQPLVDQGMRDAGIHLSGTVNGPKIGSRAAFAAGHAAGANVAINAGIANRAARQQGAIR